MLKTQCLPVLISFEEFIGQEYTLAMKIRKAYKFRLKPDAKQEQQLTQFVGGARFLWNKVLALNMARLKDKTPLIWYHEADYWSKLWKSSEEYAFLRAVPAHCLQQKLKDLDKAFRDGFNPKEKLKRLPTFKKRGANDSIRFPEPKQFALDNRRIKLPKLGWIGFFKSRSMEGKIKNATVTRNGSHWYIAFQVELEILERPPLVTSAVGIDVGITRFATLSNGEVIDPINSFKQWQKRLAKAQRKLARKKRFSKNWRKEQLKIGKTHTKIARVRHDFLHKLTTTLSKNHAMIVVEDLKIANMSRSAKGSTDSPGTHVKAKSGLNKSILDQGWGEFRRQLEYKMAWSRGVFVRVAPQRTSQQCSRCGYSDKRNRTTQSAFECLSCGYEDNADFNAAKNILAAGHAVLACGEEALASSVKQEPLRKSDRLVA